MNTKNPKCCEAAAVVISHVNNFRKCIFAALAGVIATTPAVAQDVRFWLSYQDPVFAAINNRAVGDEVLPVSNVAGLLDLKYGVMVTANRAGRYPAGNIMLAFDTVNTNAYSLYANKAAWDVATQHKVLNVNGIALADVRFATGLAGSDARGKPKKVDVTPFPRLKLLGTAGPGTSIRAGGLSIEFGFGNNGSLVLKAGDTVRLATVSLTCNTLMLTSFGGTYGDDASEVGVMLFTAPGEPRGSTFLGTSRGAGQGSTVKYAVTVNSATVPVGNPDSCQVPESGSFSLSSPGVLGNDTDPGQRPLQAVIQQGPAHASSFALNLDGSFTYVPVANFTGSDSFTYRARNSLGQYSALVTVSVTVTAAQHD